MTTVYIALGTNVGDRHHNLREALRLLKDAGLLIQKTSSIYETEPVDYLDQAWFLNAVLEAQTDLSPLDLRTSSVPSNPPWAAKSPSPKALD